MLPGSAGTSPASGSRCPPAHHAVAWGRPEPAAHGVGERRSGGSSRPSARSTLASRNLPPAGLGGPWRAGRAARHAGADLGRGGPPPWSCGAARARGRHTASGSPRLSESPRCRGRGASPSIKSGRASAGRRTCARRGSDRLPKARRPTGAACPVRLEYQRQHGAPAVGLAWSELGAAQAGRARSRAPRSAGTGRPPPAVVLSRRLPPGISPFHVLGCRVSAIMPALIPRSVKYLASPASAVTSVFCHTGA